MPLCKNSGFVSEPCLTGYLNKSFGNLSDKSSKQCHAINVGFELYIGIESKFSILIIGFDFEMGEFCHFDFDINMIFITPILTNHGGPHLSLPAISNSLKGFTVISVIYKRLNPMPGETFQLKSVAIKSLQGCWGHEQEK